MSSVRILVVDDYKDWRDQVRLLFQARPEWQVVCEGSDGSEAVQKADKLKPDLVLLDISLPNLNGIEAARQIRSLSPNSRIVFLSMDNSLDVVEVAMSTGARGYVYKALAQVELLPAIDAVLQGKQFVSSMIKGYRLKATPGVKAAHLHEVQFYSDDAVFLESCTHFIADALDAGDVAVSVATESHRDSLLQRLKARGLDIDSAVRNGAYIPLDVDKTLSMFMVNDMPDSDRVFDVIGTLIRAAAKAGRNAHPRLAVCGEGVSVLWAEGNADAALQLEQLWNKLAAVYQLDILCGYALNGFRIEEDQQVFQSICAEHSAVYPWGK